MSAIEENEASAEGQPDSCCRYIYSDVNFKIESEVNTFVHLQLADNEENPLAFWRKQEGNYPNLSVMAKCYLSISASSVPVEAMFSTCGLKY